LDSSLTEKKMKALGFPYTPAELDALKGKTELDAMVAYMQKLGSDIPWRKATETTVVGDTTNPFSTDKGAIAEGKGIYAQSCSQCHGDALQGGIGPALANTAKSDADLFKVVYSGVPTNGMPAFGSSLGKDKIWKIVTFLKNQKSL